MLLDNLEIIIAFLSSLLLLSFVLLILVKLQIGQLIQAKGQETQYGQDIREQITQMREFQIERFEKAFVNVERLQQTHKESLIESLYQFKTSTEQKLSDLRESLLKQQNEFHLVIGEKFEQSKHSINQNINEGKLLQERALADFKEQLLKSIQVINDSATQSQLNLRDKLVSELRVSVKDIREEMTKTLITNSDNTLKSIHQLTYNTDERLKEISGQVEKRLAEGFEKTTQTFNDVLKRLALIDDAQKKITELSSNVVSLQQVLADKRSRGAFGEIQLNSLVKNVLPENNFSIQHRLSNDKIADCILFLPEPTGNIVIDAKFPLESYQKMTDFEASDLDRQAASRQFKQDIKKHIKDISSKYIVDGETAQGAVMFIPAEAVFAEIHGHFPDLVELAYKEKVWMVSPTTLMAILTTACAVIKDEATRKQVHIIQEHLGFLSEDFKRFQARMESLSKHIGQVSKDVEQINTSAQKISRRFTKIERVELPEEDSPEFLSQES